MVVAHLTRSKAKLTQVTKISTTLLHLIKKLQTFSFKRSFHVIDMTSCRTIQSVVVLLISNRPRAALLSLIQFEITRARLLPEVKPLCLVTITNCS